MKIYSLIFSIILIFCHQAKGQERHLEHFKLTSRIDSIILINKFNGVILLSSDSSDIYTKSIGFSDLENKTKITINDLFVIGSISKQITAVLILREYQKGKIGLNDTIGAYLEHIIQPWGKEITVHQLLTHTHGIVDLDQPLEFDPGSQFSYSQLGFELLAQILENVAGDSFENLSSELFQQYGLSNTFFPKKNIIDKLAKGYEENSDNILEFTENSLNNYVAAGGFVSNAHDLKRWNELLYSGILVNKETLELMKTKYATRVHPIFGKIDYGYGLLFENDEQDIQIGALGYAPGYVSACYYYNRLNMNLVILENTAYDLDEFKKTFKVHTEIMELLKKTSKNLNAF